MNEALLAEFEETLNEKTLSKKELAQLKHELCIKHKVKEIPTDIEVLLSLKDTSALKTSLKTKPRRSGSGVAVIAVMAPPKGCPHGKCTFCPGGPGSYFGTVPQSYTGKEPSTLRAARNNYDPYFVVMNRLEQYIVMGHTPEKVELIIQGGTFPALNRTFQEEFIAYIYKAMNDFSEIFYHNTVFDFEKFKEFFELPGDVRSVERSQHIHQKFKEMKEMNGIKGIGGSADLETEKKRNENAQIRCVGLCVETKPDWGFLEQGNHMLTLGVTRVEVGIQSTFDLPLKITDRGHDLNDTIRSLQELKDLGFKITAHYMPGLPGIASKEQDLDGMKALFSNPDFRPDMLKIYPCMVFPGTKLYAEWQAGTFTPLSTEDAAEIIAEFKQFVPKYCRIMRIQRDIPSYQVAGGVQKTNLRQYVEKIQKERGIVCNCIRCREPDPNKPLQEIGTPEIIVAEYEANGGKEFFISVENKDHILGFCRLRFPAKILRSEITGTSALIRELHVYGEAAALGKGASVQHKGLGKRLMEKAEDIARIYNKNKMVVISGVGVRGYYLKLGYVLEGPYMVKMLDKKEQR